MRVTSFASSICTGLIFVRFVGVFALACSISAHADEREDLTAKIAATGQLPCAQEAMELMSRQLERMEPDLVLQGMRQSMNLGDKWTRGDVRYEQARAVIAASFDEDVAKNGPLFAFSVAAVLNKAMAAEKPDDLAYIVKFLEKPEGKLFWEESIDGGMCNSWLKTISRAPYPAMDGETQQRWEKATASLKGERERFVRKLNALPKAAQSSFYDGSEKITPAIQQAPLQLINERNTELGARLGKILSPKMKEINAIIDAFKASNG